MTLSAWDCHDIDALAAKAAKYGKKVANQIYKGHAARLRWAGTPKWIEGRTRFMAAHRAARTALLATQRQQTAHLARHWADAAARDALEWAA